MKPKAELLFNIANEYLSLGDYREALHYAMISATANKNHPDPFCRGVLLRRVATIFMMIGDFDNAIWWHKEAIKTNPREVFSYCGLSACKKYTAGDPLFQKLTDLLTSPHITVTGKMYVFFALGKMYDDIGDYDTAWENFRNANMLYTKPFPFEEYERYVQELETYLDFDLDSLGEHGLQNSDKYIFIVGMPRSGTTLLDKMLEKHSQIASCGELMILPVLEQKLNAAARLPNQLSAKNILRWKPDDIKLMADIYAYESEIYASKDNAKYYINKVPGNFIYLPLIKTILPRAKIIHCTRDMRDVALSCYMQNFENYQEWSFRKDGIVRYINNIYKPLTRLIAQDKESAGVMYEDMVSVPDSFMKGLIQDLGLQWEDNVLNYRSGSKISSASLWQIRQPIFTTSIGRYKNYEQYIPEFIGLGGI